MSTFLVAMAAAINVSAFSLAGRKLAEVGIMRFRLCFNSSGLAKVV